MLGDRSRYASAQPFDPPLPGRRDLIRAREIRTLPGVVEHALAEGDRPDLLAHHYYGNARLWWRILDANPQLVCGADLTRGEMRGHVIVIPAGSP